MYNTFMSHYKHCIENIGQYPYMGKGGKGGKSGKNRVQQKSR